jgi:hypothetical protein
MNDIQRKLIERYKTHAVDWYQKNKPIEKKNTKQQYEEEDTSKEIELIESIEKIIQDSNIEESRKAVFLGSLRSSKEQLVNGHVPERLPSIVRNLCTKEGIGGKIKQVCMMTKTAGQSYDYLWGI